MKMLQRIFLLSFILLVSYSFVFAENSHVTRRVVKSSSYTKVITPTDYKIKPPQRRVIRYANFTVVLYSRSFSQGDAVYMEILPVRSKKKDYNIMASRLSIAYQKKNIVPVKRYWGYRALFGIDPEEKNGVLLLQLHIRVNALKSLQEVVAVSIHKTNWPSSSSAIQIRKKTNRSKKEQQELNERIWQERQKKIEAFGSKSRDQLSSTLSHPRDMHYITSEFWKKRKYNYYDYKNKKRVIVGTRTRIHKGLDLRARTGAPIYAMADGTVVLARQMYYEGNFILIDHGNRIFTGYMHQSKLLVKEGDKVKAGEQIGIAGASGRVAGAHLHLSLHINGTLVEPLSLLSLPIRD